MIGNGVMIQETAADLGFIVHESGLTVSEDVTREQWIEMGKCLGKANKHSTWMIGDWILTGEQKWGEKYDEAAEMTGLAYQTLRHASHVCSKYDLFRRRNKLSFAHHADAAALEPEVREQLLDEAEEQELSSKEFRKRIAEERGSQEKPFDPINEWNETVNMLRNRVKRWPDECMEQLGKKIILLGERLIENGVM